MLNEDKCELKSDPPPEAKCSLLQKLYSPTIRLTIALREPDEEYCSVFNYRSLLSEEKRNRRREREKIGENQNVDENEDADDEIKKLAAHFEEKYGGGSPKKKKKKKITTFYNYTELASGYDESDSFIDNSEAFDEALPDEMETFHGGYYVNIGQLEFKKIETVDDSSETEEPRVAKKKASLLNSDDSNDNDSSKSESSDSESETEDIVNESKKLPEENDQKEVESESNKNVIIVLPKIHDKFLNEKSKLDDSIMLANGDFARKKKKKYKKRHISDDTEVRPKKKARTVKTLLEEKRIVENDENFNGCIGKSVENFLNSVNDVIESVVNAARNHLEDSRDSTSSSSETKSIDSRTSCETEKENHLEETEVAEPVVNNGPVSNITKELIKLPDDLPSDVLALVSQLKSAALSSESGARTFFSSLINCKLLCKLEKKTRSLSSPSRLGVYTYLASFFPCSRDTLMKRARKLLVEEEEKKMSELMNKLKSCIDTVMPTLMDNYLASCHKIMDEKSINGVSTNEIEEKNSSQRLPKKTFVWNDEMRNYVNELTMCHLRCLHLLKPKKESSAEHLKKFLETKVKPLWPSGWMDTPTLLIEGRINNVSSTMKKASRTSNAHAVVSAKKSQLPVPNSNNLSPTSVSVPSTTFNLLTNSLALQSLSMQYSSQPDLVYSAATAAASTSTSIPYRSDLNLVSSASPISSTIPFSMDVLSRIAATTTTNQQYPITSTTTITTTTVANPYSKSISPTKKQTTSLSSASSSSTLQRAFTSVVSSMAGLSATPPPAISTSFPAEPLRKSNEPTSSKFNDMFKIDSLIGTPAKSKKEHHQLNHVSQYNKHYSHKIEKKKISSEKRENNYISRKSPVNLLPSSSNMYSNCKNNSNKSNKNHNNNNCHTKSNHNIVGNASNNSVNTGSSNRKLGNSNCNGFKVCSSDLAEVTTTDQVLDLSPIKIIKTDKKSDVVHVRMDQPLNYKNDSNTSHAASAKVTARDHSYWSSVKEEIDVKEERCDPIVTSGVSTSDNLSNENGISKPVHLSRKQRILQESIKTVNQDSTKPSYKDGGVRSQMNNCGVSNHVKNDAVLNVISTKSIDDRKGRSSLAVREDKKSTLLDGKQNVEDKKRKIPLPSREDKRLSLPKDIEITETTTATDILSKIINESLQEGKNSSSRSSYVNSTYNSLEKKLDRDARERELKKNRDPEIKLTSSSSKESQPPQPSEKKFGSTNAERKPSAATDRVGGPITTDHLIKNLSIINRLGAAGHRADKKPDRDSRDKERTAPSCETEIKLHLPVKESQQQQPVPSPPSLPEKKFGSTNAERMVAAASSTTDRPGGGEMAADDLIKDLMVLNNFGGHSIPRRMEQIDAMYNLNANELNGSPNEVLNQSSLSSSSKPRNFTSPYQDEFRKHISRMDPGFMSSQ